MDESPPKAINLLMTCIKLMSQVNLICIDSLYHFVNAFVRKEHELKEILEMRVYVLDFL